MQIVVRVIAYAVILAVMLGAQSSGALASGQSDIEKVVFVHYRAAPTLPDAVERAAKGAPQCPDPTTCADFSWSRYTWASTSVGYQLNPGGSGVAAAATTAAVAAGFAAWTGAVNDANKLTVNGSLGTTSCSTAGAGLGNGVNQVCWRDITNYPGAIAVTYMWGSRATRQILEADVVFNSGAGFSWSYRSDLGTCGTYGSCNDAVGSAGTYDIRDIGTHEFGHFLAWLGDLYRTRDSELTMYGYGSTGEVKKDSLGRGDCLGITKAYGGTCP